MFHIFYWRDGVGQCEGSLEHPGLHSMGSSLLSSSHPFFLRGLSLQR